MTDTKLYCLKLMFLVYTYDVCNVILCTYVWSIDPAPKWTVILALKRVPALLVEVTHLESLRREFQGVQKRGCPMLLGSLPHYRNKAELVSAANQVANAL